MSKTHITVYSDYLSDNLYLLHPSMAGAATSNLNKQEYHLVSMLYEITKQIKLSKLFLCPCVG